MKSINNIRKGEKMNTITLIGRLVRDPDLRYTQNGTAVCNMTIAVDRPFTNQNGEKEVDFIDIVVWRKAAENVAKYMTKGKRIGVVGSLQVRSYEDKEGVKRKAVEVLAGNIEFLDYGDKTKQTDPIAEVGEEVYFDENDQDLPF